MAQNIDETLAELSAALGELERGEELSRFVGGHGCMSLRFEFDWRAPGLEIRFRLPYARVLDDEEKHQADQAEIGAAIRMAMLLLTVGNRPIEGAEGMALSVWADGEGAGYSIMDAEGETVDSGDDWAGLVHRLEALLSDGEESLAVIWP